MPNLILGSGSPRRKMLLGRLGVRFEVMTADVDEDQITAIDPAENVAARALLKANALMPHLSPTTLLLTVDTTVALDGEMLNKPVDQADARAMLRRLSGRAHQVYTGFVVTQIAPDAVTQTSEVNVTDLQMRPFSDAEIDAYVETGDPMDKAGAYAIQHPIFKPVDHFAGCYTGVVGLPLCDLRRVLSEIAPEVIDPHHSEIDADRNCNLCSRLFVNVSK